VYRETVTRSAEADARFERAVSKAALEGVKGKAAEKAGKEEEMVFGAARVRVSPRPRGSGILVRHAVGAPPAELPEKLQRMIPQLAEAATTGVRETVTSGPSGYPMEDLEAVVIEVEPRDGLAAEAAQLGAKIAGAEAFRRACAEAEVRLLEPIMHVEVVVPEEFMGAVVGDLNSRRAQIEDVGFRGTKRTVTAKVPLKALFGYATSIRSASQGRATFTMRFARYDAWA
jgi:elongation factor G